MITKPSSENILGSYLDPGEKLLWTGRPKTGVTLRAQDAFLIPFSLMWCGFAIFWELSVIHTNAPLFFKLWGIPFVCVGLFLVFGRFFFDAYSRQRTHYGLTNERILILHGVFTQQVKSLPLSSLADISLSQSRDGSGTITFGNSVSLNSYFPGGHWPGRTRYAPPAFDFIDRAKDIYDLIRQAQRNNSGKV